MFQLYHGHKLDVDATSASLAAAWNWIPAPSSVIGSTCFRIPVLQDGFVELPTHLLENSGRTEADPLMIKPSKSLGPAMSLTLHHSSHTATVASSIDYISLAGSLVYWLWRKLNHQQGSEDLAAEMKLQ